MKIYPLRNDINYVKKEYDKYHPNDVLFLAHNQYDRHIFKKLNPPNFNRFRYINNLGLIRGIWTKLLILSRYNLWSEKQKENFAIYGAYLDPEKTIKI